MVMSPTFHLPPSNKLIKGILYAFSNALCSVSEIIPDLGEENPEAITNSTRPMTHLSSKPE